MTSIKPKLCAVCWGVLDRRIGTDHEEWIHNSEVIGISDHKSIPVDYDDARVQTHCDFCHDLVTKPDLSALPAKNFQVPVIGSMSMGAWAACPACAKLIQDNNWDAVADRAMKAPALAHQDPETARAGREWMKTLYVELQKNMTGPIRKWQPGDEEITK